MHVRSRKSPVAALAASLVVATAVVTTPQLAAPAHAGTRKARLENTDLIKLNTTWGDARYSLNLGADQGSTSNGWIAQTHHDNFWDNPSRFRVESSWIEDDEDWHMLRNNHSQKCLTASGIKNLAYVVQRTCDAADPAQWWAGQWGFGDSAWIRNLGHHRNGLNTVMSQRDRERDGSPIQMETIVPDHSRQEWYLESCLVNGVPQKDC